MFGDSLVDLEYGTVEPDELDEIWDLYSAVVMNLSGTSEDPLWVMGVNPSREKFARKIEQGCLHAAYVYGQPVAATLIEQGFVGGYETFPWKSGIPLEETAVLRLFAVVPNMRGHKISTRFLNYCISAAREQGYKALRLDVMPHLAHSAALFTSCGFESQGLAELAHEDERMRQSNLYELVL